MLKLPVLDLVQVANSASSKYYPVHQTKRDGSIRKTWNARPPLKSIQARIKCMILAKVIFPNYLHGGLPGRDYKSNADAHTGSKTIISEDITDFFPSISYSHIHGIWRDFFHFPEDVSDCLARLTTKDGFLPQGAKTSAHLANLVLWDVEPEFFSYLKKKDITYTRLIDDITLSSKHHLSLEDKGHYISVLYSMLRRKGFEPKRKKHKIFAADEQMLVNGLLVNVKPALSKQERSRIRAYVAQLRAHYIAMVGNKQRAIQYRKHYLSVSGKVGKLTRFHPYQGKLTREILRNLQPESYEREKL